MILNQQTWKHKWGRYHDLVSVSKLECERTGIPYQVFKPVAGAVNTVIIEFQFEDMAEYERFWINWNSEPEAQAYLQQLPNLAVVDEHRSELYQVLVPAPIVQPAEGPAPILEQVVLKAKAEHMQEVTAFSKAECERWGYPHRLYTPMTGPHHVVIIDLQFESMVERGKHWATWGAEPGWQAFHQRIHELLQDEERQYYRVV
jgi:hypothetical protein